MGNLYADRGFISVNGVEVLDIENITVGINDGTKFVPGMTRNRRPPGKVKGNREVDIKFTVAVQQSLATPKLENLDFTKNVALTFEHGGDRYTCPGLDHADTNQGASGVGTEGKKDFHMLADDIVDQIGNSALFSLALS